MAYLINDRMSSDLELPNPISAPDSKYDSEQQSFSYLYTAKAIWRPAASVCSVYTITIAIFPGFLAEDVSSQKLGSWYPVLLITAFNLADVAGKVLPVQERFALQNRYLILNLCLARLLFLPAFYIAAGQGLGPSVMSVLTLALGLSNGYLTAISMMVAPQGLQVSPAIICEYRFVMLPGLCMPGFAMQLQSVQVSIQLLGNIAYGGASHGLIQCAFHAQYLMCSANAAGSASSHGR